MFSRNTWLCMMTPRAALAALGIKYSSEITHATVKKAYLEQTLRCHPDLHPDDPNATERFRSISEALRVVLKSLEARGKSAAPGTDGDAACHAAAMTGPESVMKALQDAVAAYQKYRDNTHAATFAAGGAPCSPEEYQDPFADNSLERVSSVCRSETAAMQRVRRFCSELPEVLCGRSCTLFEAVVFFNPRYVEAMSQCVLRFSKNLPIIVSRVVKSRNKHVRYRHTKTTAGFGTGSRPQQQRIEDMSMKPLVLVGALIFDQAPAPDSKVGSTKNADRVYNSNDNSDPISQSTCGVTSKDDVMICDELKCIIYPSHSISDITERIGRWEAASFSRLQLELAIMDTTSLMSDILELKEHTLRTMHQLHLPRSVSEKVSLTVQKLACGLCYHCDEKYHGNISGYDPNGEEDHPSCGGAKTVLEKILYCRHLAHKTASHIRGNIILTWESHTSLVESTEEIAFGEADEYRDCHHLEKGTRSVDSERDYLVVRHMSCCDAETIQMSVSITLSKNLDHFLNCLIAALTCVVEDVKSSLALLPSLLELRDGVVKEEFIPVGMSEGENVVSAKIGGAVTSLEDAEGSEKDLQADGPPDNNVLANLIGDNKMSNVEYRYRGPIRCFHRIFAMNTSTELLFWKRLHKARVYVAKHAPAMNPVNVYYNCMPYKPHTHALHHKEQQYRKSEEVFAGWAGEEELGEDAAVITERELQNDVNFMEWLEDVVEQSSLNKDCQRVLHEAGINYITRDPLLPLQHYLSFVKVFCGAVAVREVLENDCSGIHATSAATAGLSIVVGTECDVRDGGQLLVPWWLDPSALLALLQGGGAEQIPCLN